MRQLRKDELEELEAQVRERFHVVDLFAKKRVQEAEEGILIDGEQAFIKKEGLLVPALHALQKRQFLKQVVVDAGAVPFVCKGADVMRPGIVSFDAGIQKDELVAIVDVAHKKALAVGKMLFSGEEAQAMTKGRVVQNVHFVGDEFWKKGKR